MISNQNFKYQHASLLFSTKNAYIQIVTPKFQFDPRGSCTIHIFQTTKSLFFFFHPNLNRSSINNLKIFHFQSKIQNSRSITSRLFSREPNTNKRTLKKKKCGSNSNTKAKMQKIQNSTEFHKVERERERNAKKKKLTFAIERERERKI